MTKKLNIGFTLIELMVTVAIVVLLATIALPSYQDYILKSRRAEGKSVLLNTQQLVERAYTDLNRYDTAVASVVGASGVRSEHGYYMVTTASATVSTYSLNSAPQGGQASDKCKTLTINQAGATDVSGVTSPITRADCW